MSQSFTDIDKYISVKMNGFIFDINKIDIRKQKFINFIDRIYIIIKMSQKMKYGYWFARGNGQIGRLLLVYTGANWEDVKYSSPDQWFGKDKKELDIPFANLPYLIDGDFKITQAKAINTYIIMKSGKSELLGNTIEDQAKVECLVSLLIELRTTYQTFINTNPQWKTNTSETAAKVGPKLESLAKFYGEKDFALGYLTLADFYVAEYSYHIENIFPDLFKKHGFLKRTRASFESLPEIKKYYSSDIATKAPFFPGKF